MNCKVVIESGRILIASDYSFHLFECMFCHEYYGEWLLLFKHLKEHHSTQEENYEIGTEEESYSCKDDTFERTNVIFNENIINKTETIEVAASHFLINQNTPNDEYNLNNIEGNIDNVTENHDNTSEESVLVTSQLNAKESNCNIKLNGIGKFQCNYCTKTFHKQKYLNVHITRHTKQYAHKCKYCAKETATASEMSIHLRSHTNAQPYKCNICQNSFKYHSSLAEHHRKHAKPTIQCSQCSKAFYNNYKLKCHMNVHLNRRDYICEFCKKCFTSAKILYGHKISVHSELRENFCKSCNKCFPNLQFHIKTKHKK